VTSRSATARFAVVVPVKPPAVGKSRLGLDDDARRRLAAAFALDTVAAALAAERVGAVLVVTDDAGFSSALVGLGARAIPDGVALDLNATLAQGAAEAARRWPDLTPVALCADLPALTAADLDAALEEAAGPLAEGGSAYVADTEGTGTTLYAAPADGFEPRFGVGSAAAHAARGAVPVRAEVPTLRRDVDDLDDLDGARRLGLGRHTAALAAAG
jgi:2-phospho-L-lactate guanylyltransferase